MFKAFYKRRVSIPYGERTTQYIAIRAQVKRVDNDMVNLAKAAIVAGGGTICEVITAAYAQALSKYRAKLEAEGRWEQVLAEHNAKRAETQSKRASIPRSTKPESRPAQVFEG